MPTAPTSTLDLSAIHPRQIPSLDARERNLSCPQPADPGALTGGTDWEAEALRLRAALEDVIVFGQAGADATQRVIQMQRRAIAALSGLDPRK